MVLPLVQFSGGQLQQQLVEGIAVLLHQRHVPIPVQRQNGHPAGVEHHLPLGLHSVGQLRLIHQQGDDLALIHRLA